MLDSLRILLEQSPMLALFAVIGIGYAIGRLSVGGFSLDIGGVLFAGLAIGAMAPKSAPPALVSSVGLVMFLYGIGIQYGRQFFDGLRGPGLKWNALGVAAVLASLAVALGGGAIFGLAPAHTLGLFAGALTSTPTLQAAIDTVGDRSPAVGYSVAYPMGIIVPILCLFVFSRVVKARLAPAPAAPVTNEILLDHSPGTVADVTNALPANVRIVAIRQGHVNRLPDPQTRLEAGDTLLLFGEPGALGTARQRLGRAVSVTLTSDRSSLDLGRFFVSRAALTGVPIGKMTFPDAIEARIVEVRRGDAVLLADSELELQLGDRVALVGPRDAMPRLRQHFGDSIKSTTEVSYMSVGLGMSLGVLLGLLPIPIPIPGFGRFTLGLAGGPLLMALVLGKLSRTGPLTWHFPLPANLTLRTFGLTLFLAAVGLGSGAPFVETLKTAGLLYLWIGTAIVAVAVLVGLLAGHLLLRIATDELFGIISGITGNPAILVYGNKVLPSDRIDAGYATVFPTLTILKILCAQIALSALR